VTPQRLAAHAVHEVLAGRSLTPVLERCLAQHPALSARERGALWDLAHGTLRHLGLLQAVLGRMLRKPIAQPELAALLAVALYQMEFTKAPPYAIVNEAVNACAAQGSPWARPMVNALLRRFQRERTVLLAQARSTPRGRYSYPDWWIERVQADYPQMWKAVLDAGNARPSMALRVNRRRESVQGYLARLATAGIDARAIGEAGVMLERIVPVTHLPGFGEGLVSVQDPGAQAAAEWLDLTPGQRVLDACAAPGGKTAHILEKDDVELLALDADAERLGRVRANLERLGLHADVRCADAADLDAWWDGRGFDRVLADVPCTASGVVRRHPDIKWLRRVEDVASLAAQAARLLDSLWRVVVPGGKLLLVTCSVFQEENRAQVDDFVGRHADARIEPLPGKDGLDLQLLPDASHDGFYYALLQRCPS
jgi:16S rRNA (cytosine967-C5)-methyltransferase